MEGLRVYIPSSGTFGTVVSTTTVLGITNAITVSEDRGRNLFYVGKNDDLVFVDTGLTRLGVEYSGTIPEDHS
ncbi:unknown [Feldmannia species virus]|uniref:Uncharacterized protein n=1 Tax=Feldmannia species virus TaxID=39420 RepID=B5LWF1_9PHYC|nr:hypothetical protein FeldSpV_gp062 [Feldmannia species virus]ACH46814.1 unknown [Feldmannia species virus]